MTKFDASQQRVFGLDPSQHARVLGAPGTGKTLTLVETFALISEQRGWQDGQLLVLAPSRSVASVLRKQIERRVERAIGGTPVRTATSFAFSVLQRRAAVKGETALRLLTGTAQDEAALQVTQQVIEGSLRVHKMLPFAPEVLQSEAFRGELRELGRVLDDFALAPGQLAAELRAPVKSAAGGAPPRETVERWHGALELFELVQRRLLEQRPGEVSASAMMRAACEAVESDHELSLPRLVMVDDAGELGEGALALLAALANRGTKIWVFGDPDTATGAFQGERARVLAGLSAELERRGVSIRAAEGPEQSIVLEQVHRHSSKIRGFVRRLTERVGTAGVGQQRLAAAPASEPNGSIDSPVQFATVSTASEQLGVIAHRLRARHLGLAGGAELDWAQMAVVCRTRGEAKRVARLLSAGQVPTNVAAGGVVLREHLLVRELIRLLQHSLGICTLAPGEVHELLGGVIGGLDPIAARRLRGALRLHEVRAATTEKRVPESADGLMFEAFQFPGEQAVIDTAGARRLRNLGRLAASGETAHAAGATPREVLWQLWQGSKLPDLLQTQALEGRGARSDEAHRSLDAVLGLFFALQRHEEQDSDRPIEVVLEELLSSALPEDTLAARSERDVVTVGTAQALVGREFELVCVLGLQDGTWPNLRSRGSLLGVAALERWLRGEPAETPSRRDTLHDELRLFAQAASRARTELLVIAIANEDEQPSPFFVLGREHTIEHNLPSSRLTLRGAVAEMRRRVVRDTSDQDAVESLALLVNAGVAAAHPDSWYGVMAPSTRAPLNDIESDPLATVSVSPSQLDRAEECPLDWVISRLGGSQIDYRASIGTLLHHALETVEKPVRSEQILEVVKREWGGLHFEAEWQDQRAQADAEAMSLALADYLRDFEHSDQSLIATEAAFEVPLQFARLRGFADRLEARHSAEGSIEITVVDLKTGRKKPTAKELEQHAQLQAYQLGVIKGAFLGTDGSELTGAASGAKLLYVHPQALTKTQQKRGETYTEVSQQGLGEAAQQALEQRIVDIARVMAASSFTAQVEHHCANSNVPGKSCALHIIPAVSYS